MSTKLARSLVSFTLLSGCTSSAAVSADARLPLRSVVLYRSGVGYFERTGSFEGQALRFRVKQHDVGDFLASLTTVSHTGAEVRSVSFEPPPSGPAHEGDPEDERAAQEPPVDVTLSFASAGEHALSAAYVVGAPVWRPSYRIVFDAAADQALLQAWAVVQNESGEDWRDVKLGLTTGAPISFRTDLGTPIVPERPWVSDTGEVVQSVPTGETVIAQHPAEAAAPKPAPPSATTAMESDVAEEAAQPEVRAPAAPELSKRRHAASARGMGAGAADGPSMPLLEHGVRAHATAAKVTETVTRYDLSDPVTVPSGGSTMVAIVSTRVRGEQAHLYAPDPGVGLSHQHPFSVVRLQNGTGAVLEKGPISVLANGSFLGQGLLDSLPREAQAFVPFAVDKSVVVEPAEDYSEQQGTLMHVQRGVVTVQRFSQRKTLYRIRNGATAAIKVYVRHGRWGHAELTNPPSGTELAPDKALLPIAVAAKGKAELAVIERTPVELSLSLLDPRAAEAISLWLSGAAASDPASAPLRAALALRAELTELTAQIELAEREQAEVNAGASEARKNLKAVEKLPRAKDLKDRLYARLKLLDARNGELLTKLIEARTRRAELEVRLHEALEGISLSTKA